MDRAGKVTKQFGWLAKSLSGISNRNENRLEMLQLWRQEPGHWLENEFCLLRGISVQINRGQGTMRGGRGPVKLIQKAELGWKKNQGEALASLGCTHAKACSYYILTPHIYHSITRLLPFILIYHFSKQKCGEVRNFCSFSAQKSWALTGMSTWSCKRLIKFSDCQTSCVYEAHPFTPWKMIATVLISKRHRRIVISFCITELWVNPSINGA